MHDWVPVWGSFRSFLWEYKQQRFERSTGFFILAAIDGGTGFGGVFSRQAGKHAIRAAERQIVKEALEEADVPASRYLTRGLAEGEDLADDALVVRGGRNLPDSFIKGSGLTVDNNGLLQGVSVNSAAGKTIMELATGIPHNQIGVTTVGRIRLAGGDVVPSGTGGNPFHCTLCGITPNTASKLFTPTIRNPNK